MQGRIRGLWWVVNTCVAFSIQGTMCDSVEIRLLHFWFRCVRFISLRHLISTPLKIGSHTGITRLFTTSHHHANLIISCITTPTGSLPLHPAAFSKSPRLRFPDQLVSGCRIRSVIGTSRESRVVFSFGTCFVTG